MPSQDVYNASLFAYSVFDAFLLAVAGEVGMERALALDAGVSGSMGSQYGQMLKEQSGVESFDAPMAWAAIESVPASVGTHIQVVREGPMVVSLRCEECPLYAAGAQVGMDNAMIEQLCRNGAVTFMDAIVKQLDPRLSYRLDAYRSSGDDVCMESIVLE